MTTGPAWEDPIVVNPDEATARAAADARTDRVEQGAHQSEPLPDLPAAELSAATKDAEILLEVNDIKVHFPIRKGVLIDKVVGHVYAVDGVSLAVKRGETYGLVGESGCGKTTLGRAILRLIEPTAGSVLFDGVDVADLKPEPLRQIRHRMQMVFQDPLSSLDPRQSVQSILEEGMRAHGIATSGGQRLRDLLSAVGLPTSALRKFPHEFSGGQRQRFGIARALAVDPELIVADEPVSALDVSIQAQILNLLRELQRELGITLVFIAHDLSVVRHMCDRVAVMYLGRIVETATSDQLYAHPRMPYTGALMSAVPVADPRLAAQKKRQVLAGDVPSPTNPPKACRFHTRCWKAQEICRTEDPPLEPKEGGNVAACHFPLTDAEVAERVPTFRAQQGRNT